MSRYAIHVTLCEVDDCGSHAEPCECGASHCADHPHADGDPCAFCGEPSAEDVYQEDGYPDMPCCADEDACHARRMAS